MTTLEQWHQIIAQRDPAGLDAILAPDCVFYSPIVHTPQPGRDLTRMYLSAAMQVFNDSFEYTKQVVTLQYAVLEFNCEVDGIVINGVDIMSFDEDGLICEFKVMVRPLKAINLLHAKMHAMLEQMSDAAG